MGRQAERRESQVKVLDRLFEGGKRRREEIGLGDNRGAEREEKGRRRGGREERRGEWLLVGKVEVK